MILSLGKWMQHISNPLHVYCRLMDLGMKDGSSRRVGAFYERYFYHYLMRDIRWLWSFSRKGSL